MILGISDNKKIFISTLFFVIMIQLLKGQELTGVVTYGYNNTPMSNVTVKTRVSSGINSKTTITDYNGRYSLLIDSIDKSVMFFCDSSIFRFEEYDIDDKTEINVSLKKQLDLGVILIDCYAINKIDNITGHSFEITKIDKIINININDSQSLITLLNNLSDTITYPYLTAKEGIQGKVWASFETDSIDMLTDVSIIKGVDKILDNTVKEAIKSLSLDVFKEVRKEYKDDQFGYIICVKFGLK